MAKTTILADPLILRRTMLIHMQQLSPASNALKPANIQSKTTISQTSHI
jgi:hypothetical protein